MSNPNINPKTTVPPVRNSTNRSPLRRGFLLIPLTLALAWFALSQTTQAVVPALDGGYPGGNTTGSFNTASGAGALLSNAPGFQNTADTAWRQYGFSSPHTSFNESETILTRGNVSQLTRIWSGKVGRAVGSAPIFGRATVFAASDGRVVALKAHTGERRWGRLSCSGEGAVQPALGQGVLLVGDGGGDLAGYDPLTGDQVWCDDESGSIVSAPAVEGDTVYITNGTDAVALNQLTGGQRWRFTAADFNPLTSTPAIANGTVFVTGGNAVFALDQGTGRKLWRHNLGFQANISAPSVSEGIVYVGGTAFYALSVVDGHLIWTNNSVGVNVSTPAIAAGKVFVNSQDPNFGLWAFDAENGSFRWMTIMPGESLATVTVANGVVYDVAESGELMMFNSEHGGLLGKLVDPDGAPFLADIGAQAVVANGTVYISTGDQFSSNRVDAFRLP
jgi:outer membrane protein assembly factor BamB